MFSKGKGAGVTGIVKVGKIKVDEEVDIVGMGYSSTRCKILGIDSFDKTMSYAEAGDSIKMYLRVPSQQSVTRGQSVVAPTTFMANKRFTGHTKVLVPEEGGREHTFNEKFQPQVFFYNLIEK